MEDSKKKSVLLGIVVACFVLAGGIAFFTMSKGPGGAESLKTGEMMWVKCANPNCNYEGQMEKKAYYQSGEKSPTGTAICPKCNEPSLFDGIKCEKCGIVFIPGSVRGDVRDRCPECGYSKSEGTTKEVK